MLKVIFIKGSHNEIDTRMSYIKVIQSEKLELLTDSKPNAVLHLALWV